MNNEQLPRLFSRQRVMLALLHRLGGTVSSVNFQKYLFLFTEIYQQDKSYEFVPYKYGCFSFQSYSDRRKLIELGVLSDTNDWDLQLGERLALTLVDQKTNKKIEKFAQKFSSLSGDDLIKDVYRRYPYYATKSEIAVRLMTKDELNEIEKKRASNNELEFFTIGYEGQSFENYLNRLLRNNIHLLVDVRKNPLSRKYGFSKKTLSETLSKLDIGYIHMPELGIKSDKRRQLISQKDYDVLFNDYEKTTLLSNQAALDDLFKLFIDRKRVAITCFEATQCMCHRGRIAKALGNRPDWTFPIIHI